MPVIFGDRKKKMAAAFGKIEDGSIEVDSSDMDGLKALAEDVLQAVRDGSAERLAHAFKAMYAECENYEDED